MTLKREEMSERKTQQLRMTKKGFELLVFIS